LTQIIHILQRDPSLQIRIEGHTCSLGDSLYNLNLARERAESMKQLLMEQGIQSERIGIQAFGEQRPLADNRYPLGRILNRRVRLVLYTPTEGSSPR